MAADSPESTALAVPEPVAASIEGGESDHPRANAHPLPELTDAIEAAIHETEKDCLISSLGGTDRRLHLVDDTGDQLCDHAGSNLNQKPLAAYPPGHFDICRSCATIWRYREHGARSTSTEPASPPRTATDGGVEAVRTPAEFRDWSLEIRGEDCSVVENDTDQPTKLTVWTDDDLQIPDGVTVRSKTTADGTAPAVTSGLPDAEPNSEVAGRTKYHLELDADHTDDEQVECIVCDDQVPKETALYGAGKVLDDARDGLEDGDSLPVDEVFEFDDGPYCGVGCLTDDTGGGA